MNIIKQTAFLLLYGVALGMIPVSLNYIENKFGVPKDISISAFIVLILLSTAISKWNKLPRVNLIVLGMFIVCATGYGVLVAIDYYVVDYFEPNVFWMMVAYSPLVVFAIVVGMKDAQNPEADGKDK